MQQQDDYVSGPHHHYWLQFAGGFIFGAGLGLSIGLDLFESRVMVMTITGVTAFTVAFVCGRWGERAWHRISDWLQTWWRGF